MAQKKQTVKQIGKEKIENIPAKRGPQDVELAKMYAEDAKENLDNVRDAFYRISIQGGRFKVEEKVIGDKGVEFTAVIVKETPVNIFYETKYDPDNPTNPDCWSLGGLHPDVACSSRQSEACAACKQNRFGSGSGPDGEPSKGKACKNTRRLVLKIEGVDLPCILSLPPTSIKPFNGYLKELSRGETPVPMFGLTTIFSFAENEDYPKPLMSAGEFLNMEEYLAIKKYRATQEVETALKAYASPEEAEDHSHDSDVQTYDEKAPEGKKSGKDLEAF